MRPLFSTLPKASSRCLFQPVSSAQVLPVALFSLAIHAHAVLNPSSDLVATTVSSTQIDLSWIDNATSETGFRIEQSPDNVAFTPLDTTGANATAYSSIALDPATKFYYRVVAFNGSADSDTSEIASATTLTPFADWQQLKFTESQLADPAISGPTANPDGDPYDNQTEFAFFGDPLVVDTLELISATTIEEDPSDLMDHFTITTTRNKLALDVAVAAEFSGDLSEWSSDPGSIIGPLLVAEDTTSVTEKFRVATPVSSLFTAFLRLRIENKGVPDSWIAGPNLPVLLAEVGGAVIGSRLFLFGGRGNESPSDSDTLAYNLETGAWDPLGTWADRPYQGNHQAVEVFNGKLYVFGGFGVGSEGKLQIFDPTLNVWTTGTDVPYAAGSINSARIGNFIYLAGGEKRPSRDATTQHYRYNPADDTWASMASVPEARHHCAAGTDGAKFYIFGGRFSFPKGYGEAQIYDPASDTWVSSSDNGSTLMPLPTKRSGMGKAVFYKGEFYTFGGEDDSGDLANTTPDQVYPDVEIYNPATNSWRTGAPMPTPRHGSFPILYRDRIYLPGGGPVVGGGITGSTDIMEIYIPGN